jgi:hypothetical protein
MHFLGTVMHKASIHRKLHLIASVFIWTRGSRASQWLN